MSELTPQPGRPAPLENLEDLYENAPCGYLSMRADGRIFKANGTLSRWMGVAADALVGKRFRDLLTLPGRILYETQLAPLIQTQAPLREVVLDLLTTSGETLPVIVSGVHRRDQASGEVFARLTLTIAQDRRRYEHDLLTSRETAEARAEDSHAREVAANQMLADTEEASALREQFIAVLGHDLRNPLASISGAARLLGKQPQTERSMQLLELSEQSVRRMAALIDNVLDFARGRLGGGLTLDRRLISVQPVLTHVVEEMRASFPERAIETDLALDEPVSLDPVRISQLLSNLLGNAITHGDPTAVVRVGGAIEGGIFDLWVANGGEPIPEAAMQRLFHPFFRGEVRPSQQGLGLGLYIASEIAAAHGGELSVRSSADETRFTARIPVARTDLPDVA